MEYDPFWSIVKKLIKQLERQIKELEKGIFPTPPPMEDPTKNLGKNDVFFYGYSVTMGPDGKPIVREFGNAPWLPKESKIGPVPHPGMPGSEDILVEVYDRGKEIEVLADMPGFSRDEISVEVGDDARTITIIAGDVKKRVRLSSKIKFQPKETSYKNGVLRLVFEKRRGLVFI